MVASEVKYLASQTTKATEEIGHQIGQIQAATSEAVAAIHDITATIEQVSAISTAIAAAVQEQQAATLPAMEHRRRGRRRSDSEHQRCQPRRDRNWCSRRRRAVARH